MNPISPISTVRQAMPSDVSRILELVHALADYERAADQVEATEDDFLARLFPEDGRPAAYAHVAEVAGDGEAAPEVVGIAVWFLTFSTWTGTHGIWLEDLYVDPAHRGSGLGKALLAALAQVCRDRGYARLEWTVLDWNAPSIAFYESLGARPQSEWTTYRLAGDALSELGALGVSRG